MSPSLETVISLAFHRGLFPPCTPKGDSSGMGLEGDLSPLPQVSRFVLRKSLAILLRKARSISLQRPIRKSFGFYRMLNEPLEGRHRIPANAEACYRMRTG